MYANLNLDALGIYGRSFDEALALAKRFGFAGIDASHTDTLAADPSAALAKLQAAGLRWGGAGLPVEFRKDEATYHESFLNLEPHAKALQAVGCTRCATWIMPGHNELNYRANFEQHAQRLKPVAALLADHGLRFGIEFVGPRTLRAQFKHTFLHTIDQCLELVEAIDPPGKITSGGAGVLLDGFHWFTSQGTVDDIVKKLPSKRIVYVHVNDAKAGRSAEEQIDSERALPGETGVIDIKGFMGALRKVGYDGPVTCEPFMPELAKLPIDEAVGNVAAALKKIMT